MIPKKNLVHLWVVILSCKCAFAQSDSLDLFDSLQPQRLAEVVVIDNQELDHLLNTKPLSSVEQHLEVSEQINFVRRGAYAWEPTVNNMSSERLVLTIDGMRIFGACTDRMDPITSYVDVSNLSQAEVSSGQEGSEFGSCIGGGLNLCIAKPSFGKAHWRTGIESGFESVNNQRIIGAELTHTNEAFYYSGDVIYRKADRYRIGGGELMPFSQFEKFNISFNGGYKISDNDVVRVLLIFDEARDVGYPALPMDVSLARGLITSLDYEKSQWGKLKDWHGKIYFNSITHIMDDSQRPDVPIRMDMPGCSNTIGFLTEARYHQNRHHWHFKWDGFYNQSLAEMTMYPNAEDQLPMFMLTWPDVRTVNTGFFIKDHIHFGDQSLEVSYRANVENARVADDDGLQSLKIFYPEMSSSRTRFIQSINLSFQKPINKLTMDWALGFGQRTPSVSEAYGFYLYNSNDNHDYVGNPNLHNESTIQASFAARYELQKWLLTLRANHSFIPNYILGETHPELSPMTIGAQGVRVYQNLEYANIFGASLTANFRMYEHWKFSAAMAYAQGVDNRGMNLPFISPVSFNSGIQYQHKTLSANFSVRGALPQYNFRSGFGEDRTPAFCLVNMDAGKNFRLGESLLQVKLGVENLMDLQYHTYSDWNNISRPGRNLYVNISYNIL